MVRAVILVKAPKLIVSAKIREIESVIDAFDVCGRFDAIALIETKDLSAVKETALKIQAIVGVKRTETLVEVP